MQTLRKRVSAGFPSVEKTPAGVVARWDAKEEVISVPGKKKGEEPTVKPTGMFIVTERLYKALPSMDLLTKEVNADLDARYKDAEKPVIDIASLMEEIKKEF